MKSAALMAIILLLNVVPALAKPPVRTIDGFVSKVSDGDTVQVQDALGTKVKVRLYGIDGNDAGSFEASSKYPSALTFTKNEIILMDGNFVSVLKPAP
ncbi:thermonuclease family protein [Citrifermentans bremense]|uniref:thermonuclease family protein n=1 Tax=Citrifermentans bremense TaxID=60035 RepID=UPI00047C0382|nr:hypothetical protein [Citrifermentans bremense]